MATLIAYDTRKIGAFQPVVNTLTADDTIPYDATKNQVMVCLNSTGSPVTVTIDGDGGGTSLVDGLGGVNVAAGYAVVVPANQNMIVKLSTIRQYCQGVVHALGGTGLKVLLLES